MTTNFERITESPDKLVNSLGEPYCYVSALRGMFEREFNCLKCGRYSDCNKETATAKTKEWAIEWLQEESDATNA